MDSSGERGLLGVAFDPDFATNQFVYVYYTVPGSPGPQPGQPLHRERRRRRGRERSDPSRAEQPQRRDEPQRGRPALRTGRQAVHRGRRERERQQRADADEPAGQDAPHQSGRHDSRRQPLLRHGDGQEPRDLGPGPAQPLHLRLPAGHGPDVHQRRGREHASRRSTTGSRARTTDGRRRKGPTTNPSFRSPLYSYQHSAGTPTGCAITGGAFYNPPPVQFPADYVGEVLLRRLLRRVDLALSTPCRRRPATSVRHRASRAPWTSKVADDGSLFYLARGDGTSLPRAEHRQPGAGDHGPAVERHRDRGQPGVLHRDRLRAGSSRLPVAAERDRHPGRDLIDLHHRLRAALRQRSALPLPRDEHPRQRHQRGSRADGHREHGAHRVDHPAALGHALHGGRHHRYAGTGTDAEDGTLPASAFTWQVDFHHDTHIHPFVPATTGATSGSFTIPTSGETSSNVWYRIHLTVRDSGGLTHETFRDVLPAQGRRHAPDRPAGPPAAPRRPARDRTHHVHRSHRHRAKPGGAVAADRGRHDLRVRVVVGWRGARAQHLDARGEHDLHGDVPGGHAGGADLPDFARRPRAPSTPR